MAISGPSSYVPTTDEFIAHWGLADVALGAGNEMVLAGGVNLAGLTAKKGTLVTKRSLLQAKLTELEVVRGEIEIRKQTLLDLFGKFVDRVRSLYPGTKYERALPTAPGINDSLGVFTDPMDAAAALWQLIQDDPALPDILIMGVTQAQFALQSTELKTAYTTRTTLSVTASVTREERNDLQDEIYAILKNYRQALPTHFATGHAMSDSLPRLTPQPGSTPDAVTANGTWDAAQNKARLTFTLSEATDFDAYELRMTPGPDYSAEDDVVVASSTDIQSLEFLTDAGPSVSGVTASYKVYVKTTTGNEIGSNTVVLTRP